MPLVRTFDGHRVVIYPNDHRPAHVHVFKAEKEAVFLLNCPAGPVELRENLGFRSREIAAIAQDLDTVVGELCAAWETIHGFA